MAPRFEILSNGLTNRPSPRELPHGPDTLASLLTAGVRDHPDRLALIDGDHTLTYAELQDEVSKKVAASASPSALESENPSGTELIIAMLSCFRLGEAWVAGPVAPERPALERSGLAPQSHDAAIVAFTSGTTGEPKRVVHSHQSALLPALVSAEVEPAQPGERIGTPLDLRIANVAILGPISTFVRGSTFVVLNQRFAKGLADDIEKFGVTRLFAVPTLAFDLVEDETVASSQLKSLDRVILGGSGGAPEVLAAFLDKFGVRPTLSYGLSEAPTGVVRESLDDDIGSGRGFPLPHIEVQVVDSNGETQPPGSVGEICLLPATTGLWAHTWTGTLGYLGEPDRTAQLFDDGVLHTGDTGFIDDDGALTVTGRLSNLIIRGGKNIDPIAIEAKLCAMDSITDALAVGIDDDRLGQRVGVLVVEAPQADTGALSNTVDLAASLRKEVGEPIDDVVLVPELPTNELGKRVRVVPPETFSSGGIVEE